MNPRFRTSQIVAPWLLPALVIGCSGSVSTIDLPPGVDFPGNGVAAGSAASSPEQHTQQAPEQPAGSPGATPGVAPVTVGAAPEPGAQAEPGAEGSPEASGRPSAPGAEPSAIPIEAPTPGGTGPGGPDLPSVSRAAECDINSLRQTTVRRLSNVEYRNTLEALLGVRTDDLELPGTVAQNGFKNSSVHLSPSALLVERYQEHAQSLARAAVEMPSTILSCEPSSACGEQWVQEFGLRAFRRPLSSEEFRRYHDFFESKRRELSFNAALELTIAAFIQSPNFIYRVEMVPEGAAPATQVALTPYEMASRLSYLVLQSMPDEELFAAAARGGLSTDAEITAQVERLMALPAAAEAYVEFHRQWLQFEKIEEEPKSVDLYPEWRPQSPESVQREAERFVHYLWDNGLTTTKELLTNRTAIVDDTLASIYGVAPTGNLQSVSLSADERAGILTRAAFVAGHSHNVPSPPLRGNAVLEQLLCTTIPAPPPAVDTSTPTNNGNAPMTNRELFEAKLEVSATCQGCHVAIDGVGYLFENYDAIGRYQTNEPNGLAIDPSGALNGTDSDQDVRDAVHLSNILGESDQVTYCAVRNMYRFAFGRDVQSGDWCKTDVVYDSVQASGGDLRQAILAIATSHEFKFKSTGTN